MRYPEIDLIKGIAVILMVIFHYFYVAYLMEKPILDINSNMIHLLAVVAHNIFIFMVGVNMIVSYKKHKQKNKSEDEYIGKQFKRALLLFIFGMIMTFVTYYIFPAKYIQFGIFHFISLSIIVSLLFINNINYTGIGIILFSILNYLIVNHKSEFVEVCQNNKQICFILGIFNYYSSIDHFSFIPFFLTVLFGMGFGQLIYSKDGKRNINIKQLDRAYKKSPLLKSLGYVGKQSLNIYLVHFIVIYYLLAGR